MKNYYMYIAYQEAEKAYKKGEIPVGAVIVNKNKIIAKTHNLVESKKNATYHAEILAIKQASKKLKNWRLLDCNMYVTLQPCEMCSHAIKLSRIEKVYYAATNKNLGKIECENIKIEEYSKESEELIKNFFNLRRK